MVKTMLITSVPSRNFNVIAIQDSHAWLHGPVHSLVFQSRVLGFPGYRFGRYTWFRERSFRSQRFGCKTRKITSWTFLDKILKEGFVLFTIPREITLSTRTCPLLPKFGEGPWKSFGLHKGWAGLILCMLWEESLGSLSKWHCYLCTSLFQSRKERPPSPLHSNSTSNLRYADVLG
jgi:hypothetical protein